MMCEQQRTVPPLGCPRCPHHILTAPVSYRHFCQAFGFPTAAAGTSTELFLLFYEHRSSSGALIQSGRATGCPPQGHHPENLLFDYQRGYLWTLLEVCDDISSILLYSNYSPCQEAGRECALCLGHFLQAHPWVRLDLLFSRLYHTQPTQPHYQENCAGLRSLASLWPRLSLSPISGAVWCHLLRVFVSDAPSSSSTSSTSSSLLIQLSLSPGRVKADRQNAVLTSAITGMGPAFLDLPPSAHHHHHTQPAGRPWRPRHPHTTSTTCPPPLALLPPPHLTPPTACVQLEAAGVPPAGLSTCSPACRPVNVVRHVRMPSPRRHMTPPATSTLSSLLQQLQRRGGRTVEVVQEEVTRRGGGAPKPNVVPSRHRHSERDHQSRRRR